MFSFGELLVLLDVDGAGAIAAAVPTPAEASSVVAAPPRGNAPCVELHGTVRFLSQVYAPPHAELVVTPAYAALSITQFHDEGTWTTMFDWVSSYLADTLGPDHVGQGVIATLGCTRPNARLDSRDLVIEVAVRRDEPELTTIRRIFGLAADVRIAPPDDGNWRELPTSWPMHLECSSHGDVRFRFSAPHHDSQISSAGLCEEWSRRWLDLCASTGPGSHDRSRVGWDLGTRGHASIVRGDGTHRRDVHELHVPTSWL